MDTFPSRHWLTNFVWELEADDWAEVLWACYHGGDLMGLQDVVRQVVLRKCAHVELETF